MAIDFFQGGFSEGTIDNATAQRVASMWAREIGQQLVRWERVSTGVILATYTKTQRDFARQDWVNDQDGEQTTIAVFDTAGRFLAC